MNVPKGWKLVPIEPTEAMKKAGGHANSEWLNYNAPINEGWYGQSMDSVYKAILDAAPDPPSERE